MSWTVSKLDLDLNQNRATVGLDSNTAPSNSIMMQFTMPNSFKAASQAMNDGTKRAVVAQAKQILADAANSL